MSAKKNAPSLTVLVKSRHYAHFFKQEVSLDGGNCTSLSATWRIWVRGWAMRTARLGCAGIATGLMAPLKRKSVEPMGGAPGAVGHAIATSVAASLRGRFGVVR